MAISRGKKRRRSAPCENKEEEKMMMMIILRRTICIIKREIRDADRELLLECGEDLEPERLVVASLEDVVQVLNNDGL